jgi:hypothetical protein
MERWRLPAKVLAALILLLLSVGAGGVRADPAHVTPAPRAEAPAPEAQASGPAPQSGAVTGIVLSVALALLGVAGLGCLPAGRGRIMALALSLAVGVFTLEAAVHSIHHLGDPATAATCPVLCGSGHLSWGEPPASEIGAPPLHATAAPRVASEDASQSLLYRPHQGRAPPA